MHTINYCNTFSGPGILILEAVSTQNISAPTDRLTTRSPRSSNQIQAQNQNQNNYEVKPLLSASFPLEGKECFK